MASGVYPESSNKSFRIYWSTETGQAMDSIPKTEFPTRKGAVLEAKRREVAGQEVLGKDALFLDFAINFFGNNYIDPKQSTCECFFETINWFDYFLTQHSARQMRCYTDDLLLQYKAEANLWGRSHSSINRDLAYLKMMGDNAMRKGVINNFERVRVKNFSFEKKIKARPTTEERDRILNWFKRKEPYFYAWMYFIITRGRRRDEFRKVLISDVELDNKRIILRHTKTGEDEFFLTDEDCLVLNEHIILLKNIKKYKPNGLLHPPLKKGKLGFLSKNLLLRYLKIACNELRITKPITLHSFRHMVVSNLRNAGMSDEVVMAITGHKDPGTIEKFYSHSDEGDVRKGLEITRVDTGFMQIPMQKRG